MNNLRFATALHIVTLLATAEAPLSSAYIAGSININAAVVRKEVMNLKFHGLVETKEGKGGGITLAKPASIILLSDVYKAVSTAPLLGRTNEPNPACLVGKQINQHLNSLYAEAENSLVQNLSKTYLSDFVKKFG